MIDGFISEETKQPGEVTRSAFIEYGLWLISRLLLIVFVALVAIFLKIPIQRAISADAAFDIANSERQQKELVYSTMTDLCLSATKLETSFDESRVAITQYELRPNDIYRHRADSQLHVVEDDFGSLHDHWRGRNVQLEDRFETAMRTFLQDAESAVQSESDLMRDYKGERDQVVTFQSNSQLLTEDLDTINALRDEYVHTWTNKSGAKR